MKWTKVHSIKLTKFIDLESNTQPSTVFNISAAVCKNDNILKNNQQGNQSSAVTIMAMWNTMIGTSVVALPWALHQSGLAMGLFVIILMTAIATFTALTIVKLHSKHSNKENDVPEFAQLCGSLLGPKWEHVCAGFSLVAVLGVAIVYWILMSNFIYNTMEFGSGLTNGLFKMEINNKSMSKVICPNEQIKEKHMTPTSKNSNDEVTEIVNYIFITPQTTPIFLTVLLPMVCLKSTTFFTKFNSLGTINIFFLTGVVFYFGASWGINANITDINSDIYIPMFKNTFPSLSGMMALGLFIHNAILTIVKKNKHQENNKRDITAGFFLVSGTYMIIGIPFYLTFPMGKNCIEDNFLNNFHVDNPLMIATRLMLLFQLITVFPLIMYIFRSQFFMLVLKTENVGYRKIFPLNTVVLAISICFAMFIPTIGNIIRYVGGLCGAVVVFILPSLAYLVSSKNDAKLNPLSILLHVSIICLGIANFVAQFFV